MKILNKTSFVLAIVFGIGCTYLFIQLKVEHDKNQTYLSRLHKLAEQLPDTKLSAVESGVPEVGNLSTGISSDVAAQSPHSAAIAIAEDSNDQVEGNPAAQYARYETWRRSVLMHYGDLIELLKLSGDRQEDFVRLLIEMREETENVRTVADTAARADLLKKIQIEMDSRVASQLGEYGFSLYKDYEKTLPFRREIIVLNMSATAVGVPLDRKQKDQLLAAMLEEQALMPHESSSGVALNRQIAYDDRLRERFSKILNPEQIRQFDSFRALRLSAQPDTARAR